MERRRLIILSVYMICALLSLGIVYLNWMLYSEEVVGLWGLILRLVVIAGSWIAVLIKANGNAEDAVESGAKLAATLLTSIILIFHVAPFAHMAMAVKQSDSEEAFTIHE